MVVGVEKGGGQVIVARSFGPRVHGNQSKPSVRGSPEGRPGADPEGRRRQIVSLPPSRPTSLPPKGTTPLFGRFSMST
jgi:hypothetical protein